MGVCADVFVTVSLADSIFFSSPAGAARGDVLLYLLLTMAPFAVVAPVLGPLLDKTRGGRRLVMSATFAGRALLCFAMASALDELLLYPLVFLTLVLSKGASVSKSALVPTVIDTPEELVAANSRLALIGVIGGIAGGPVAAAVLKLTGPEWVLRVGAIVFVAGVFAAIAIPRPKHAVRGETPEERELLHTPSIVTAGGAMAIVRGVVGFTTFFAAFVLKKQDEAAWVYGVALLASALGNGLGTITAPLLRRRLREEWILAASLVVPSVPLLFAAREYGRSSLMFAASAVAFSAASARLAFDSLLQRDGHDAVRGRSFARFETRFQIVWVVGGVLATLFFGGGRSGVFLVALVLLFGGLAYVGAVRRQEAARNPRPPGSRRG